MRAIAISLVLCAHLCGTGIIPMSRFAHVLGDAGVRTFFVLSGFLITTLLMRERAAHGRISLVGFYWRRCFRIFPAFYTYIAVVVVLAAAGVVVLDDRDLAFAATYTMNFHGERAWTLGHLWSLAVEEQFYLVWPLVVVVCGLARGARCAIAAIVLAPMIRLGAYYAVPALRPLTDQAFPCVADALATGCLLALARARLEAARWYRAVLDARGFWLLPAACVASLAITRPWFQLGLATSAANLGIALALHRCLTQAARPEDALVRVLEHPALVRVGALSYSLYLWQQLFLNRHGTSWVHAFPVNLLFASVAAVLSYRLVEQPLLRLGHRLQARRAARVRIPLVPEAALSLERVLLGREGARRRVVEVAEVGRRSALHEQALGQQQQEQGGGERVPQLDAAGGVDGRAVAPGSGDR